MPPPAIWLCCDTLVDCPISRCILCALVFLVLKLWIAFLLSAMIWIEGSGAVCLAHCDGSSTCTEVPLFVKAVTSMSNFSKEGRYKTHTKTKNMLKHPALMFFISFSSAFCHADLSCILLGDLTMTRTHRINLALTFWVKSSVTSCLIVISSWHSLDFVTLALS